MPAKQLGRLITDLGERSLYDAVSQCSRCGYCEQACPTYVATGKEAWSGRGRNQVVRMLLEGKFLDTASAEEALSTCLLCGACTSVCPAHVPTADIVLEGRRLIRQGSAWSVKLLSAILEQRPRLFAGLLKTAYFFKRWGLSRLFAATGLFRLFGLRVLEEAEKHVEEAPRKFLFELLKKDCQLQSFPQATWLYFAACGPNYILSRIGLASVRVLKAKMGRGAYLDNSCCGLLSYNYGDLGTARRLAQANIERLESIKAAQTTPVIADCSSCVAYLKTYPQLFMDDAAWKKRAMAFSSRIYDIIELIPAHGPSRPKSASMTTYHDACRARNGQGIISQPRAVMRAACAEAYRELPEADACCGGAGAFAFLHPGLSEDLLRRKIGHIASTQARTVVTSSTSCLIQLARGLKKYYPACRVIHLSELLAENLNG